MEHRSPTREFVTAIVNYLASVLYGCTAIFLFAFDKPKWAMAAGAAFIACFVWQYAKLRALSDFLTIATIAYVVVLGVGSLLLS